MRFIESKQKKHKLSVAQFLALGYLITIVIGTILLLLPIATKSGQTTSLIDAIFTATSATCVTGLIPFDTFTHWTMFGQIVILCLIQIGGIGFMTIITLIFMMFRKNIGRIGLSMAINYFTIKGYTVSIPMNDTQWYDIVVEKDGMYTFDVAISIPSSDQYDTELAISLVATKAGEDPIETNSIKVSFMSAAIALSKDSSVELTANQRAALNSILAK